MTLLGQNVNSYRDTSQNNIPVSYGTKTHLSKGFQTIYKTKEGGRRFADLLDKVAMVSQIVCLDVKRHNMSGSRQSNADYAIKCMH